MPRLEETLQGTYRYVEKHFNRQNLYLEAVEKNNLLAEYVIDQDADIGMLQRNSAPDSGEAAARMRCLECSP